MTTSRKRKPTVPSNDASPVGAYPEFGVFAGDPALSIAFAGVIQSALSFVCNGLYDITGQKRTASLDTFELLLKSQQLEGATGGGLVPTAAFMSEAWAEGAYDRAKLQAHGSLLVAYKRIAGVHGSTLVPPWLSSLNEDDQCTLARSILGVTPEDAPTGEDPLRLAYDIAHYNVRRAEQRVTLLVVLGAAARGRRGQMPSEHAESEYSEALTHLWQERYQHITKVLALGTLLGGYAHEANVNLVKRMFGPGMSVINLIQVDGRVPGHWRSATEDALRQSIENA